VAQGCTFAFDSKLLEDTALVVQLCSDNKVLLERTVMVKSLTYTGQTFFISTLHFGGLQGTAKNNTPIPTIMMVSFIAAHDPRLAFFCVRHCCLPDLSRHLLSPLCPQLLDFKSRRLHLNLSVTLRYDMI
jgi:hypothetical protein